MEGKFGVFVLVLCTLTSAFDVSSISVELPDPDTRDGRSFIYTSAVSKNGESSSFSIFTGSDGNLHYMKETQEGQLDHGVLDEKTPNGQILQKDALFYFPNQNQASAELTSTSTAGERMHQNLQMAINGAVQNYLNNIFGGA